MAELSNPQTLLALVQKPVHGDGEWFERELFERQKQAILTHQSPEVISQLPVEKVESEVIAPPTEDIPPVILPPVPTQATDLEENPDRKLTKTEMDDMRRGEREYREALSYVKDAIAPSILKVDSTKLVLGDTFVRSFFSHAYPDFLEGNWLSPLINWDIKFDMSIYIYPDENDRVMKYLKKRLTELGSQRAINMDKWLVSDPALDAQIQDVEELRQSLARWSERYFHFSLYVTLYEESEEGLKRLSNNLETLLGGRNILTKPTWLRTEQAFTATGPFARDEVGVYRNISTTGLSTSFPFTSSTLTHEDGILYGVNTHNNSLIIFDRFRSENANMTVFAKSGWGKSFAVKLEILRALMLGIDVIVIDPENEYKPLVDTVGGGYINISLNARERLNPFDLPKGLKDQESYPGDRLREAVVGLIGLMNLLLGKCTPSEESILERAMVTTYSLKWITLTDDSVEWKEIPLMKDFYSVLETMDGGKWLTERLDKYVNGVFSGIFSSPTNVELGSGLQVFSVRDLDEFLRPAAMYIMLWYVWNLTRSSLKKRLLVVDEAWNIMQYEASAKFLFGLVKRARKYGLGVTTITQDVEDFMSSNYGKAIVTNGSIQLLLKQSPASIDVLQNTFKLTDQEKYILLNAAVGQWLFFAGTEHVGIQVLASAFEESVVITKRAA